jgi:hypothetical protein
LRRKLKEDEGGQSALFDAVMFLIIMIVASSLITVYAAQHSKDVELKERQDMMEYARETAEVVLGATLSSTWYEDIQGRIIEKPPGDTTVLTLILEELYLLDFGVPKENFALGYEKDIKTLTRNLVAGFYHFAIMGYYLNESANAANIIFISDIVPDYSTKTEAKMDNTDYTQSVPRNNLASCEIAMPLIDKDNDTQITFSLWN